MDTSPNQLAADRSFFGATFLLAIVLVGANTALWIVWATAPTGGPLFQSANTLAVVAGPFPLVVGAVAYALRSRRTVTSCANRLGFGLLMASVAAIPALLLAILVSVV